MPANIYSDLGTKMVYLGHNGYPSDIERANLKLKIGDVYTLKGSIIGKWSSKFCFEEVDGYFNSVMFEEHE